MDLILTVMLGSSLVSVFLWLYWESREFLQLPDFKPQRIIPLKIRAQTPSPLSPEALELAQLAKAFNLSAKSPHVYFGEIDNLSVELAEHDRRGLNYDTRIDVQLPGASAALRLTARDTLGPPRTSPTPTEDEVLDSKLYCFGPVEVVRASLNYAARAGLLKMDGHVRLINGRFTYLFTRDEIDPESEIRAAVATASHLQFSGAIVSRLFEIATSDPIASLRSAALRSLGEGHPNTDETREAVTFAADDTDHDVRLEAARFIKDDDRARQVVTEVLQRATRRATRKAAIMMIGSYRHRDDSPLLARTLSTAQDNLLLASLEAIANHGDGSLAMPVRSRIRGMPPGVRARGARTLGSLGGTVAEAGLIELLSDPSEAVVRASAQGLGEIGGTSALVPLRDALSRHPELSKEIGRAQKAIVQRGAATGGELALVEPDGGTEGAVSLRSQEAGSLAEINGDKTSDNEPV